jgi:hypothetical protein
VKACRGQTLQLIANICKLENEGISGASFCGQAAALVPDMFLQLLLSENHKIANNSATTEASEKICINLESLELKKNFLMYVLKIIKFSLVQLATNF